jgi:hypothetical protein
MECSVMAYQIKQCPITEGQIIRTVQYLFFCNAKLQLFYKKLTNFRHQLLEKKHMEQLQLQKLQLAQAIQQVSDLGAKLQGYNYRKNKMVDKVHSVM